ncbi:hypothetical protein SRHO_G00201830 [Serrasalmus rhombeus]
MQFQENLREMEEKSEEDRKEQRDETKTTGGIEIEDDKDREMMREKERWRRRSKERNCCSKNQRIREMRSNRKNGEKIRRGRSCSGFGGRRRNKCLKEGEQQENTDLENEQNKLQQSSWPVSPNGGGLLISVKPLSSCPEPVEEAKGTPSPADHSIHYTAEDGVEEQESSTDPGELGHKTQSLTDSSEDKLSTTVETTKELVLRSPSPGTTVPSTSCSRRGRMAER